LIAFTSEVALV